METLKELQFRITPRDSRALTGIAKASKRSMGKVLSVVLETATGDDVANGIVKRINRGVEVSSRGFKTSLRVSEKAVENLKRLSALSGLPAELVIRLLAETYFHDGDENQ